MDKPNQVMTDVEILPAYFPIPGMGFLAVNAFVIKAKEPVLIDTGMEIDSEEFMRALETIIDPNDLKWVWLTHDDADHTGSIKKVLDAAPNAQLAANSLAVMRMNTVWDVPMHRVCWLNSGDSIEVGDRKLTAIRPPLFDNPSAIAVYDDKSEALFSADFFGAIIPAPSRNADEVAEVDLAQGMTTWASVDSPWVHMVASDRFNQTLDSIRQIAPKMVFSSHLPPARGKTEQFLESLAKLPTLPPFAPPNQMALEQILAQMKTGN